MVSVHARRRAAHLSQRGPRARAHARTPRHASRGRVPDRPRLAGRQPRHRRGFPRAGRVPHRGPTLRWGVQSAGANALQGTPPGEHRRRLVSAQRRRRNPPRARTFRQPARGHRTLGPAGLQCHRVRRVHLPARDGYGTLGKEGFRGRDAALLFLQAAAAAPAQRVEKHRRLRGPAHALRASRGVRGTTHRAGAVHHAALHRAQPRARAGEVLRAGAFGNGNPHLRLER